MLKGFQKFEAYEEGKHGTVISMVMFNDQLFIATTSGVYVKTCDDKLEKVELVVHHADRK